MDLSALSPLGFEIWIFKGWQLIMMVLLVALIIFWLQYRKRQM